MIIDEDVKLKLNLIHDYGLILFKTVCVLKLFCIVVILYSTNPLSSSTRKGVLDE